MWEDQGSCNNAGTRTENRKGPSVHGDSLEIYDKKGEKMRTKGEDSVADECVMTILWMMRERKVKKNRQAYVTEKDKGRQEIPDLNLHRRM